MSLLAKGQPDAVIPGQCLGVSGGGGAWDWEEKNPIELPGPVAGLLRSGEGAVRCAERYRYDGRGRFMRIVWL